MNKKHAINGFKKTLGVFLIILGTLGLFLPLLQGIALIALGAAMLGNQKLIRAIKKLKDYIKKKLN